MKYAIVFFCCAVLFSACVRNNPKPVWLSIDEWVLDPSTNPSSDPGMLTHNFSDVWVYVDNKLIGVFELPCKIPVLTSTGNKKIQLYPTIRNNGMFATKKIYPFVKPVEMYMDLVEGQTYQITPHTQYYDQVDFWVEDFSSPSQVKFETDPTSDTDLELDDDPAISMTPGNDYGHIHFSTADTKTYWLGYTTTNQELPKGEEVYLEIECRTTNDVVTGLLAISASSMDKNDNITIPRRDPSQMEWKKVYIDLRELVSYYTSAEYYKQYLKIALDSGDSEGDVYIDNVKVVHF